MPISLSPIKEGFSYEGDNRKGRELSGSSGYGSTRKGEAVGGQALLKTGFVNGLIIDGETALLLSEVRD